MIVTVLTSRSLVRITKFPTGSIRRTQFGHACLSRQREYRAPGVTEFIVANTDIGAREVPAAAPTSDDGSSTLPCSPIWMTAIVISNYGRFTFLGDLERAQEWQFRNHRRARYACRAVDGRVSGVQDRRSIGDCGLGVASGVVDARQLVPNPPRMHRDAKYVSRCVAISSNSGFRRRQCTTESGSEVPFALTDAG